MLKIGFEDALFVQKVREYMKRDGRTYATYPDIEEAFWALSQDLRANIEAAGKLDEAQIAVIEEYVPDLAKSFTLQTGIRVEPA